ncbi:MAG: hypothetical protein PHX08_08230 [Lachnospiraceae bacterium]|nr:hypothetical protein [Lachnospiraceae bacterium]
MSNDDLDCVNQIVERIKSQEHLIKNLNKAIDQREREIVSLRSTCDNLVAENNMLKRKLIKGEKL